MSTSTTRSNTKLLEHYSSNNFRERALKVVEILEDYLKDSQEKNIPVINWQEPEELITKWKLSSKHGEDQLEKIIKEYIKDSNHLHSPDYAGHQVATALPTAAIAEFVYALMNSPSTIYEMGPAAYAIEQAVVCWMAEKIGFCTETAGAVLTSGGSLGNLTALLAARQIKAGYNPWQTGVQDDLAVIVSDQNHYSISRAIKIMGLGDQAIYSIPVDENFKFRIDLLDETYQKIKEDGRKLICVCASACSTATGTYDDINAIANFCEANDIWLHVDGAHGASAALSENYKNLVEGINRADSLVWDAHKMMAIPSLITAIIYKERKYSYDVFSQHASYLLDEESIGRDICNRTVECTKPNMALKLYLSLMVHGEQFFADYIDYTYGLARDFAELIKRQSDFELAKEPESNIVCFRYLGTGTEDLNKLQTEVRKKILKSGKFYLVQTDLNGKTYLRVSLMSPMTTLDDLEALLGLIR